MPASSCLTDLCRSLAPPTDPVRSCNFVFLEATGRRRDEFRVRTEVAVAVVAGVDCQPLQFGVSPPPPVESLAVRLVREDDTVGLLCAIGFAPALQRDHRCALAAEFAQAMDRWPPRLDSPFPAASNIGRCRPRRSRLTNRRTPRVADLLPVVLECYLETGTLIDVAEHLPPTRPSIADNLHLLGLEACRRASAAPDVPRVLAFRPYAVQPLSKFFADAASAIQATLANDRGWVVIDYAHEGYTEWMMERMSEALDLVTYEIDPDRLVLLTGDVDGPARAPDGRSLGYRTLFVNYFGALVASQPEWRVSAPMPAHPGRRPTVLCLNRRPRLHRIAIAAELISASETATVSLPATFEGRTIWDVLECDASRLDLDEDVRIAMLDRASTLEPLLPLVADTDDVRPNLAYRLAADMYLRSDFTIVTESLFFECGGRHRFLSEKVFRPLAVGRPFFVVGSAGTLTALATLGFRSFEPAWDESYDACADPIRRLDVVLSSVRAALGGSSWPSQEAMDHNRETMCGCSTFSPWTQGLVQLLHEGRS